MLKWIVILLKAFTIVPAVVSMKKSETRVQSAYDMASVFKGDALKSEHNYQTSMRSHKAVVADVKELETLNIKLKAEVDELKSSNQNKRRRIDSQHTRLEWHSDPEKCICRGCRVLRSLTHGYADRMRGAIRRDIEAESA